LLSKQIVGHSNFIAARMKVIGCSIGSLPPTRNGIQALLIKGARAIRFSLEITIVHEVLRGQLLPPH
jgi:hypothetical protein